MSTLDGQEESPKCETRRHSLTVRARVNCIYKLYTERLGGLSVCHYNPKNGSLIMSDKTGIEWSHVTQECS